mmetsp:Transcript_7887/g.12455  ORF Transcript_7887/g.12455 Transcript_7887/m.12455 type:complete len:402 (-) Transcript_7887:255-1460(-)
MKGLVNQWGYLQVLMCCTVTFTFWFSITDAFILPSSPSSLTLRQMNSFQQTSKTSMMAPKKHLETDQPFMEPLVSTEWLEDHLGDEDLVIIDVRGEVAKTGGFDEYGAINHEYRGLYNDYLESHIPGAIYVDWTKDIAGPDAAGVPAQLLPFEQFATAMEERGVGEGKRVAVYDGGRLIWATRLWWALRTYGFDAVGVLDGGWAKWAAEGRPTAGGAEAPCPPKAHARWPAGAAPRPALYATTEDVVSRRLAPARFAPGGQDDPSLPQLVDARDARQWSGRERRARRGGRVPGALSLPYRALLAQRGEGDVLVMQKPLELRSTLEYLGVDPARPGIVYCNGGVASTLVLFALHLLGQDEGWSNYDGSWNEWGNLEDAAKFPVEADEEPEGEGGERIVYTMI